MLVGEIMTSPAVTVREDATPQVAMSLLAQRHLTMLPVVDAASRLVGPHIAIAFGPRHGERHPTPVGCDGR